MKIYLDMYYYYDAPATNKIVNWYGVILKVHQIILQSGLHPIFSELAQNILYTFSCLGKGGTGEIVHVTHSILYRYSFRKMIRTKAREIPFCKCFYSLLLECCATLNNFDIWKMPHRRSILILPR
jgi:hypothetical protein